MIEFLISIQSLSFDSITVEDENNLISIDENKTYADKIINMPFIPKVSMISYPKNLIMILLMINIYKLSNSVYQFSPIYNENITMIFGFSLIELMNIYGSILDFDII